jgi:hypothetical protein
MGGYRLQVRQAGMMLFDCAWQQAACQINNFMPACLREEERASVRFGSGLYPFGVGVRFGA